AADRGPGDVEARRELASTGHDELGGQLDALHVAVDVLLEPVDHLLGYARDPGLQPVVGLRCGGQLGSGYEQLVLDPQDVLVELGAPLGGRAAEAERGCRFVDRPVGLGPPGELRHSAPVPEAGAAVVALACVDLDHRYSSRLNTRPVGTFGWK